MPKDPITVHYQGSDLIGVPAIHFNHVFAHEVNRICSQPRTRPGAIAVELGPQTASAAGEWLRELGVGSPDRRRLPVMLGLTRPNRLIPPSLKQKALQLQEREGRDLSELPPEVLYRELGYANSSLLCLSPTDSIIEALRCALELGLPFYGVDLEESAPFQPLPILIQDPAGADGNLTAYIDQNARYARHHREETSGRREIAMAARLKALLKEHRRVLFTCGLAHWIPIRDLIGDPSLQPAHSSGLLGGSGKAADFTRVIIHPLIAIHHMDSFPALARESEKVRKSPCESAIGPSRDNGLYPVKIFENLLHQAYKKCFCSPAKENVRARRTQDLALHRQFEEYLRNLCLVSHRLVPDLFMLIRAAKEMMSKEFVEALSETFMRFPWASPDQFPGCTLLSPSPDPGGGSCGAVLATGPGTGRKRLYLKPLPGHGRYPMKVKIPYQWEKEKEARLVFDGGVLHTWTPWDFLISSMSLRAINQAKKKLYQRKSELFEGSTLEGIDMKSTLRACSRGEDAVYVWNTSRKPFYRVSRVGDGFPVVWILQPGEHKKAAWSALYEDCNWMVRHVRDPESLDQVRKKRGHKMIALIGYGDLSTKTAASTRNSKIRSDHYYGITLYQPICWTKKQFSHWVEFSQYKRNPFCYRNELFGAGFRDLADLFQEKHGIKVGEFDWPATLMLMAIPYAKDAVTVVVPPDFQVHPAVYEKARKHRVEISVSTLSLFPPEELDRLAINHMAPAVEFEPKCLFGKSVEEAIGEKQGDNQDLVPESWREFGSELD